MSTIAINSARTQSFYGLRVIAFLCVLVLHSGKLIGDVGCPISLFFVLSGFLFRNPDNLGMYYSRKLSKVFPIYWLTFMIDFFLNHRPVNWGMLPHLCLVQTYIPFSESVDLTIRPYYYQYLGASWFLSCLLFCYLVSPGIYRLIEKLRGKEQTLVTLALLIIGLALYLQLPIPKTYQKWTWYVSPYYRLLEYICGMLLAKILTSSSLSCNSARDFCSNCMVMLGLFAYYLLWLVYKTNMWVWPNLFIVSVLYILNTHFGNKVLGNKFMKICAENIMPVYLIHEVVMPTIRDMGGGWIYCAVGSLLISSAYAFVIYVINKYALGFLYKAINKSR